MKILHTADIHLGVQFHFRHRDAEFRKFFRWLKETIVSNGVELLIIAGDVFDSPSPGNTAANLYYEFLLGLEKTPCHTVVIVGGNHDSPSYLDAPAHLLKSKLNVHVIGEGSKDPAEDVIPVTAPDGSLKALVGAVPYLREYSLRLAFGDEQQTLEDRRMQAFHRYYQTVAEAAEKIRSGADIPIIMTGHFALTGSVIRNGDGVREYIGGLSSVPEKLLPDADYYALGHIHNPYPTGSDTIRYSGSPLRMSFADREKRTVKLIEFNGRKPEISKIQVPDFADIRSLRGTWAELSPVLTEIANIDHEVFLEVTFTDSDHTRDLRALFDRRMQNYPLSIHLELPEMPATQQNRHPSIREMTPADVFKLLLERSGNIPDEKKENLIRLFSEAEKAVLEDDLQAEK